MKAITEALSMPTDAQFWIDYQEIHRNWRRLMRKNYPYEQSAAYRRKFGEQLVSVRTRTRSNGNGSCQYFLCRVEQDGDGGLNLFELLQEVPAEKKETLGKILEAIL